MMKRLAPIAALATLALGCLMFVLSSGTNDETPIPRDLVEIGPGGASVEVTPPRSIIGGSLAVEGEAPWYGQMRIKSGGVDGHCGGGVISRHVFVFAAHCAATNRGDADFDQITIKFGSLKRDDPAAWTIIAKSVFIPWAYFPDGGSYAHDIAFICLPRPAPQTLDAPVFPSNDLALTVYGMGIDDSGGLSPVLRKARLGLDATHPARLRLTGIDGSYRQGDSGGIAANDNRPVGIVSTFTPVVGDPIKVPLHMTPIASYEHLLAPLERICAERL